MWINSIIAISILDPDRPLALFINHVNVNLNYIANPNSLDNFALLHISVHTPIFQGIPESKSQSDGVSFLSSQPTA